MSRLSIKATAISFGKGLNDFYNIVTPNSRHFRSPKSPSRLRALARSVFRWWYIPLVVVLFAIYLSVRLGAIHWTNTHKKSVGNLYTVYDTSTSDYGSRFLRELENSKTVSEVIAVGRWVTGDDYRMSFRSQRWRLAKLSMCQR